MPFTVRTATVLALSCTLSGCALVTTPVKVAGSAASTTIKTTGAVASAPFKMAGESGSEE